MLYETLVFSASCQIKLADVQEDRVRRGEGGGVRGSWDHGKPCQRAQQGMCVSHCVIISVPLLLEQTWRIRPEESC